MDYLKTRAPFWKLEERGGKSQWVEARASDDAAARPLEDIILSRDREAS